MSFTNPSKTAIVMGLSGDRVSYGELETRSNQLAHHWRDLGLRPGDHVAVLIENHPRFFEVCWAAERSGLYYTCINSHLTPAEVAYILDDCQAQAMVATVVTGAVAAAAVAAAPRVRSRLVIDGALDGFDPYVDSLAAQTGDPIDDETAGTAMLYSSGTTGLPKGVFRKLRGESPWAETVQLATFRVGYGAGEDSVYLSPAPLYHAAPLSFTMNTLRVGGTVVVMERFDPEAALALIERHGVTHSQWVPTMFNRLLKLPDDIKRAYDLSSHRLAIHAAAPCPVPIKQQMIAWWGPILFEYYAGTEGNGATAITSADWLAHPGSVGQCRGGVLHILDDDGNELPVGEAGGIWFEGPTAQSFEYFNDPLKTASSRHANGWSTLGDVGYVDSDGYLYLTDRKANMIISGGTNIYPQETENVLTMHPLVADVAVIGVPDDDMGEVVKAVVQPMPGVEPGPELAAELIAYCREHLASYKCPRSIDFEAELPRLPTGKLYKRVLRDRYRAAAGR